MDAVIGIAYMGCWSVRVDVAYWGGGSDVYVTSTCVYDCCVLYGYARRGRSAARKRS